MFVQAALESFETDRDPGLGGRATGRCSHGPLSLFTVLVHFCRSTELVCDQLPSPGWLMPHEYSRTQRDKLAYGTPHVMTARSRRFASQLSRRFALPVAFGDERFTTREALSRSRGASASTRDAMRDSLAAQVLLQAYLDEHHAA